MKNLYLLSVVALLLNSCDRAPATFLVQTSHFNKNAVITVCALEKDSIITGINIENNTQHLQINLPPRDFALLKVQDGAIQKEYWLYLANGNTKIKLDANDLYHYPVTEASTAEGKELIAYYKIKDDLSESVLDSFERATDAMDDVTPTNVVRLAKSLDYWQKTRFDLNLNIVKNFAKTHSDSKVSAFLLLKLPGLEDKPSVYESIFDGLSEDVKKSSVGKNLAHEINQALVMSVGSVMPNIEGTNPSGEPFDKNKLFKKANLIICWTAYSTKSMINNKALVALYNRYKDRDVEFIGVSYDKNKASWLNEIKAQHLTWPQYTDLKGAESPNAKNISDYSMLYFAIVDKTGKVLTPHDLNMDFIPDELEKALRN